MEIIIDFFEGITWTEIISSCLRILMVLLLTWIAMKLLSLFVSHLERDLLFKSQKEGEPPSESRKRIETITRLVKQGLMLALWTTASLVILQEIGVEVGPIIASAGIAGVALGFGAQNLVRDMIAGFFIILENQIRVGDVAIINDTGGLVERINFRTTVLRDLAGVVHVFPNGAIEKLANMTNEWSAYVFDLRVSYLEDTDRAIGIIRSVGEKMLSEPKYRTMMLGEPEIFGVDVLDESWVIIKGRLRTKPIRQWDVGREFLRRIKLAFDEHGIEFPATRRSLALHDSERQSALLETLGAHMRDGRDDFRAGSKSSSTPRGTHTDDAFSKEEIRQVERQHGQHRATEDGPQ